MDVQAIDRNIAAAAWFAAMDFQEIERLLAPRDGDEANMNSTKLRLYAYLYSVFAMKREVSEERAEALEKRLKRAQQILVHGNEHTAAMITVRDCCLLNEWQELAAVENAKRIRFIRHAQVAMDGCDPEACQNKNHWFNEPMPGFDWDNYKIDGAEIAKAIIKKHGLQQRYEQILKRVSREAL